MESLAPVDVPASDDGGGGECHPSASSDSLATNANSGSSTCAHCGRENASTEFADSAGPNLLLLLHAGALPSQEAKLLRKRRDLLGQNSENVATVGDDEPSISEWIFCDLCRKWFHCVCVNVQEYEVPLIDKFHCPTCRFAHGDSIMKVRRLSHRYAFDDESEREMPEQIGTEQWIRHFRERYNQFPEAPQPSLVQVFDHGTELIANFDFEKGWHLPIKVCHPHGLGLRMPDDPYFDVLDVCRLLSDAVTVDTIDVYAQRSYTMSLGRFYGLWRKRVRERLYNILSLEFSGTKLGDIVRSPTLVRLLSWVHKFWPDSESANNNSKISGNSNKNEYVDEQQQQQQLMDDSVGNAVDGHHQRQAVQQEGVHQSPTTATTKDPFEFGPQLLHRLAPAAPSSSSSSSSTASLHNSSRPFVEHFCLVGMRGSYTDFHIDFGGSSVWYHVFRGEKVFFVARPSAQNLAEFLRWQRLDGRARSETFFGDCLPPGEQLFRVHVRERETLFLPSGWIHAVFTPEDSLVFGGNFLHSLSVPMQLKIYEMELAADIEERFKFPFFELCNFYAAKNIAEILKDHTAEGVVAPQLQFDAAKVLLDKCKEWLQLPGGKFAIFNGNLRQLERELGRQRNLRRRICARALRTATAAFTENASASTSASDSPCPTNSSGTPLPSEAGEDDKLDAQELFDRSFAVEDEEEYDLEEDEEEEEEDHEEGEEWADGGGEMEYLEREEEEEEGENNEQRKRFNRRRTKTASIRRRTTTETTTSAAGEEQRTAVLEIESTGPVKLKIKLPCWRSSGCSTSSPGGAHSSQQQKQHFSVKQQRCCWDRKKNATVSAAAVEHADAEDEPPVLDVGALFSGQSVHGRRRRPSVRISEGGRTLDAQAFSSPFADESVDAAEFDEQSAKRAKKGTETKSFLAQFSPEERRQIENADRAGELDSRGQLFSSSSTKKLMKNRPKENPSTSSAGGSKGQKVAKCPMNAQQRIAKKLGLTRKKN
ncbi:hypothetical protein niasHS_005933 [Heterodera schachtii]|uniref:JmjC domain-containing protein n=1 Tax=Heterodera schachtii TaxID=97005 RepID=A0ABD2JMZ4_HETSC